MAQGKSAAGQTLSDLRAPPVVGVLGAGSWGTALAIGLAHNIGQVLLWGRDADALAQIEQSRVNRRYLPDARLPDNVRALSDLNHVADATDCFVIAAPSRAFLQVVQALHARRQAAKRDADAAVLMCATKGLEPQSGQLPSVVAARVFSDDGGDGGGVQAAVSGPSFAAEMARGLPTALTVACDELPRAQSLAEWFRTPTTRVYFSDDIIGVQLGGAMKNVIAIAAGISDGLGFGANARAALIARGLAELIRLGVAMGGRFETFTGLTGVGDLILTCTDDQSRNRRFGLGLGKRLSPTQLREQIGQEIEGANTARELHQIARDLKVEAPIIEQVYRVVHCQHDPALAVKELLGRDPKAERV